MRPDTRALLSTLFSGHPCLEPCERSISAAFDLLATCYHKQGKVLVCGNGGSAADSEHIVGELMKGFHLRRPVSDRERQTLMDRYPEDGAELADGLQGALPAISLVSQVSLCTAFANDVSSDMVFAQQVHGYGRTGDVLIGISTSGNALNVANAVRVAMARGMETIGLTGGSGGLLKTLCTVALIMPHDSVPVIQELHQIVYHALCAMLEREFFSGV
jgi:D-sedoheptulose 7-phosphate isomerase